MSLTSDLRSNPRLRIGLALIAAIFGLYALLDLRDSNAALGEQYAQVAAQLARLGSHQKQTQWPARAEEAQAALAKAEARLWSNSSIGLAQAQLQEWLSQQLTDAKAVRFGVKVAETETGYSAANNAGKSDAAPADLQRVRATIDFNTDQLVLNTVLARLASAEHQIIIETLLVRPPPQRTEITVSAWYTLRPATAEAAPQAAAGAVTEAARSAPPATAINHRSN